MANRGEVTPTYIYAAAISMSISLQDGRLGWHLVQQVHGGLAINSAERRIIWSSSLQTCSLYPDLFARLQNMKASNWWAWQGKDAVEMSGITVKGPRIHVVPVLPLQK